MPTSSFDERAASPGDSPSDRLGPELRPHLVAFYCSRARGELTTSLAFSHIMEDLNQQAGCADLVRMARAAQKDELRHVTICMDLAQRFADEPLPPPRARGTRPVSFDGASAAEQRVLRAVFGCCFGETIAVQWLTDARPLCTDEGARQENRQHLADEVKHSRLGWTYLGGNILGRREKDLVRAYVPYMVELSLALWTQPETPAPPGLESFGCPDEAATRVSALRAIDEVILPGLELCGCRPAVSR